MVQKKSLTADQFSVLKKDSLTMVLAKLVMNQTVMIELGYILKMPTKKGGGKQ
jgi:hypothetical protein